jgi:hypothetical protein
MGHSMHASFDGLDLPRSIPYRLSDVFTAVAAIKAAQQARLNSLYAEQGPAGPGQFAAQSRITECDAAQETLTHYVRQTGPEGTILLDTSQDLVQQLANILPQLKR